MESTKIEPKPGEVVVVSEIPDCNFCQDGTLGPYDFATRQGPWANGCEDHWKQHRASETLGVGKGQLWITEQAATPTACGHTAHGNGFTFVCDLPADHKGWHQQTTKLRDRSERTNWGDDGLAIHASKDEARRKGS